MAERETFIFRKSWLDMVECYNNEKQLLLLKCIIEMGLNPESNIDTFPTDMKAPLILIRESMRQMFNSYEKRKLAGQKGMQNRWKGKQNELEKYNEILKTWNKDKTVGIVSKLTEERTNLIDTFLKDHTKEDFEKVCKMVHDSKFLDGKKTDFKASFDWVIQLDNYQKIMDGNYKDNNKQNTNDIWEK